MAKKAVLNAILKRASALPMVMTTTIEKHFVKGKELLEQGHTEYNGETVEEDKTYLQQMPVKMAINHYRRMKRAYEERGLAGITDYENSIADLIEKRKTENNEQL